MGFLFLYLPFPEFIVIELFNICDLLLRRRWEKLEFSLFSFSQELFCCDLNLCRRFIFHL